MRSASSIPREFTPVAQASLLKRYLWLLPMLLAFAIAALLAVWAELNDRVEIAAFHKTLVADARSVEAQLSGRQEMERSWRTKLGYLLAKPAFRSFKKRVDYAEFGGAPLLGLSGCTLICHGGSSPLALRNAVRAAQEYVRKGVSRRIEQRMGELIAARTELRAIEAQVGRAAGS